MEKFFVKVNETVVIGLRYDSRPNKGKLMIGGYSRDRLTMENLVSDYFGIDVVTVSKTVRVSWPQINKLRFTFKLDRKVFLDGMKRLKADLPLGVIETNSLERIVR